MTVKLVFIFLGTAVSLAWSLCLRRAQRKQKASTLTRELIEKTEDDETLQELVMEHIERRVDQDDQTKYLKTIRQPPDCLRAIWATWIVQCEVENGGIGQYFWNMRDEGFYEDY